MITWAGNEATIMAADSKEVSWLFEITLSGSGAVDYYWSTKAHTFGGQDYVHKIFPESFSGIGLNRNSSELGYQAPDDLFFTISNPGFGTTGTDGVCADHVGPTYNFTSVVGGFIGAKHIRITDTGAGGHGVVGTYVIVSVTDDNTVVLASDPTDGADETAMDFAIGLDASDLYDAEVHAKLVCDNSTHEEIIRQFRFYIEKAKSRYQEIEVECIDFIRRYLKGSYPNTQLVESIFPDNSSWVKDDLCVPVPFGTAYIPLRTIFKTTQRYYLLGLATHTYVITKVHHPRDDSEWESGSFTFTQSTQADAGAVDWRVFEPIIADDDYDGTPDLIGLFKDGNVFLDVPVQFQRTDDTSALTSPEEVIEFVLEDMGIPSADIDTAGTFAAAAAVYTTWTLAWGGGYWFKQDREAIIAQLQGMCHSILSVEDKVRLRVNDTTSRATLTDADIVKDTWNFNLLEPSTIDSGYIAHQRSGHPQDDLARYSVSIDGTTYDDISSDTLELPFVSDSQDAQRLGMLHYQYKYLPTARASFVAHEKHSNLEPGDWITINDVPYGSSKLVLIDKIKILSNLDLLFEVLVFDTSPDDWGDLTPTGITLATDASGSIWTYLFSGPDATTDSGDKPNVIKGRVRVGPNADHIMMDPILGFYAGLAKTRVQMQAGVGIWCGETLWANAPFRVDVTGEMWAENAHITDGVVIGTTLSSADWAAAAGVRLDLANRWLKMGGSDVDAAGTDTAGIFLGLDTSYKFYVGDGSDTFIKYDGTNLSISVDSGDGITVLGGGDITLTGSATPGKLIFDGPLFDAEIYVDANDTFFIKVGALPTTALTIDSDTNALFAGALEATGYIVTQSNLYVDSDSAKFYLGEDQDAWINHDGSDFYIDNKTGDIIFMTGAGGATTALTIDSSQNAAFAAAVTIAGLTTTQGHIYIDSDAHRIYYGEGQDANMFHNGSDMYWNNTVGDIYVSSAGATNIFLVTNSVTALTIDSSQLATFAGDSIVIATTQSPASNGAGVAGEIAWDTGYIYVCTAENTWERAALTGGY